MRFNFTRVILMYVCTWVFSSATKLCSQTFTPVASTINSNCGGYFVYLPKNYDASQPKKYPVIIFMHGSGETGNGQLPQINKLLVGGLPAYISQGRFPASFSMHGQDFSFIVVCPQFTRWPGAGDVQAVITFTVNKYKIDDSRIYLTGLSMGGGATWDYAQSSDGAARSIAAIVPICGASNPAVGTPQVIGKAQLPVWATHNSGDPDVPVANTNGFISSINSTTPPPRILAKKTIFTSNSHDAWSTTYNPDYKENGINIYEWMLQFSRQAEALPVTLSEYKASMLPDKSVLLSWTTTFEENNDGFRIEHSTDGQIFQLAGLVKGTNISSGSNYTYTHKTPVSGSNFYRLKQIDADGKITIHKILQIELTLPITNNLQLYPNPSSGNLNIALNNAQRGELKVSIIDNNGKTIQEQRFKKNSDMWKQAINTGNLTPGHYILELQGSTLRSTGNFIKKY